MKNFCFYRGFFVFLIQIMMFYVYIIYSKQYDKYYKGFSLNPYKRLEQHNNKKSRYTSKFTPWDLVYLEKFNLKSEALKRKKSIKKYSKEQILELLKSPKNKLN